MAPYPNRMLLEEYERVYTLIPSAFSISPGEVLFATVRTEHVPPGTTLYWQVRQASIPLGLGDNNPSETKGSFEVPSAGEYTLEHIVNSSLLSAASPAIILTLSTDPEGKNVVSESPEITIEEQSFDDGPPDPTYSLTPSATSIDEGETLVTLARTTFVDFGTKLYWGLYQTGTGFGLDDLSAGELGGYYEVPPSCEFEIIHKLKRDFKTEGEETIILSLSTDPEGKNVVAQTPIITVNDTSTNAGTYQVTLSSTSLTESSTLVSTIRTTDVPAGTEVFWRLSQEGSGITLNDFSAGSLRGSFSTNSAGEFKLTHKLAQDRLTEGTEEFVIQLSTDAEFSDVIAESPTIQIRDTSASKPFKPSRKLLSTNFPEIPSTTRNAEGGFFAFFDVDKETIIQREGTISYEAHSPFKAKSFSSRPTYVYIHGWMDSKNSPHSQNLKEALLDRFDDSANVILVDWEGLASKWSGHKVNGAQPTSEASVTREVGIRVAQSLLEAGIDSNTLTVIGHSLGSFVGGWLAQEVKQRTGKPIAELVALDSAYGSHGYDTDARNGFKAGNGVSIGSYSTDAPEWTGVANSDQQDYPNDFYLSRGYAKQTTSFTASDYYKFEGAAGDNVRASTANNAYIVQYDWHRNNGPTGDIFDRPVAFHNGTISVFADLLRKNHIHPGAGTWNGVDKIDKWIVPGSTTNRVSATGTFLDRPGEPELFDGVVLAPSPWITDVKDRNTMLPKAIGWVDTTEKNLSENLGNRIFGSSDNDILFYDRSLSRDPIAFFGGDGNDLLIGGNGLYKLGDTGVQGIDVLVGGADSDQFFIGYQRHNLRINPYLDQFKLVDQKSGTEALAVIADFGHSSRDIAKNDQLLFGLSINQVGYFNASEISGFVNLFGGRDGTVFSYDDPSRIPKRDVLAFVPGLSTLDVPRLIESGAIQFGVYINLDVDLYKQF